MLAFTGLLCTSVLSIIEHVDARAVNNEPRAQVNRKHGGPRHGPNSFYQRNLDTITMIYEVNLYPNNLPFHQSGAAGVAPGLFNAEAAGRISPLGNFTNFNQSVEYFFGLSGTQTPPSYSFFDRAEIVSFTSDCPEVASSLVWLYESVKPPGQNASHVSTLKQFAFWRFDEEGAVRYYDAYIPNLKAFVNVGQNLPRTSSDPDAARQNLLIQYLLCPQIQAACTETNQQYQDEAECRQVLATKEYGDWDENWGDYLVCRIIHLALAQIDPLDHCPHVGPTGGDKCSEIRYNDVYFDDEALFGSRDTFKCPH